MPRIRLSTAEWITLASVAASIVVWAIRQEGLVNAQAMRNDAQDGAITDVKEAHKIVDEHIYQELLYIRGQVDELRKDPR